MLRLRDLLRVDLVESGKQSNNLKAVATLGVLLGPVTLLTLACILLPLWMRRGDVRGASSLLLFFIAIGLGFMLVETSQMQRLIIALGHPTYALSVVLFGLLLSSGIGSYFTRGVTAQSVGSAGLVRLVALVPVLALFGLLTPAVVRPTPAGSTPVRLRAA